MSLASTEIVGSEDLLYEDMLGEAREFHEQLDLEVKCGMRLIQTSYLAAALGIHREIGAAPLSASDMALITELGPHLARAIRIHDCLSAARNQNSHLIEALERSGSAVLLRKNQPQPVRRWS